MGQIHPPKPARLIMGVLTQPDQALLDSALARVGQLTGPPRWQSGVSLFTHTTYYNREMGDTIWRLFVAFDPLVPREFLSRIKHWTNGIEREFARGQDRRINLDPGYITEANLVLATTKDHAHRIYLGQGIFAEVTLTVRDKRFAVLPWTYPDYAEEQTRAFFDAPRRAMLDEFRRGEWRMLAWPAESATGPDSG